MTNSVDLELDSDPTKSVLIVRDPTHQDNLSGGRETMVPSRLLFGLIPQALLDEYQFWQDESKAPPGSGWAIHKGYKRMRGYPTNDDEAKEHMIIVEIQEVGSWIDIQRGINDRERTIETTGLPGRSVRVTRLPFESAQKEFATRKRVAASIEKLRILTKPQRKRKNDSKKDEVEEERATITVGMQVECDYEGFSDFWPAVVT